MLSKMSNKQSLCSEHWIKGPLVVSIGLVQIAILNERLHKQVNLIQQIFFVSGDILFEILNSFATKMNRFFPRTD